MFLLIAPYMHQANMVRKARGKALLEASSGVGVNIFCPMLYAHLIYETGKAYDLKGLVFKFLRIAEGVILYKLPGYENDQLVKETLQAANTLSIPVQMMEPYPEHLQGNYADMWQLL